MTDISTYVPIWPICDSALLSVHTHKIGLNELEIRRPGQTVVTRCLSYFNQS